MNLKHLQAFLTLSEEKSFTKTAAVLGCAQSGITSRIQMLEEECGVALFERIGKSVSLTAEGEQLLPYAKRMLSLAAEIDTLYQKAGRISIGVTESIAACLLGGMLKEFAAHRPGTEICLNILDGKNYIQMLRDGEIDLAIVFDLPVKSKAVRVLQKKQENVALVVASTHELAARHSISPEDLQSCGMLLPLPDCPYRKLFEQKLRQEGVQLKAALETGSVSVIKESSLCGVGIGLLPEFAVKKELVYHMLEKMNYTLEHPVYIQMLIHPDKRISKDLEHFLEIAGQRLA